MLSGAVLGLRVGVSGGEVSKESSDYFGDPVIEAARLCALCEGGQILVADVVQLTAGRRNRHKCRSVGTLTLKGLPDPVETVEVHWDPLVEVESVAVVPLPTRLAPRPQAGVVGREGEIDAITESVQRVARW